MDGGSPAKRPRGADGIRFAVGPLVPGIVIGKGGVKVKTIRDGANVNVSVADRSPQSEDRIITIRGEPEGVAQAMFMITQLILEANTSSPEEKQASPEVRLLIHQLQAGALIGKGGVTIKQLQTDSGAQIRLTTEALPGSTEKACIMNGSPEQIQAACGLVLNKLVENPLRDNTQVQHYLSGMGGPPQMQMPMGGPPAPNGMPAYYGGAAAYGGMGGMPSMAPMMPAMKAAAHAASGDASDAPIQFELTVPHTTGGAIIGKGGHAVKSIKQQSMCNVSVGEADQTAGTRIVTIRGNPTHVPLALGLIRTLAEPVATTQQSENITIPTSCSGAVIGKQGRSINEMKAVSGCGIQLAEPSEEAPEMRTVNITGGMIAVQIAAFLVRQRCEQHNSTVIG